jgi:hypothetical protein
MSNRHIPNAKLISFNKIFVKQHALGFEYNSVRDNLSGGLSLSLQILFKCLVLCEAAGKRRCFSHFVIAFSNSVLSKFNFHIISNVSDAD